MEIDELKELLEQNLEISRQSLKILKKIRHDILWRRFFALAKFAIIIGILIWGYVALEPYFAQLQSTFQNLFRVQQALDPSNLPPEIKKLLKPSQ